MSKNAFGSMAAGRPSQSAASKAKLLASLQDDETREPVKRVNFDLAESKHTKLKIHAAKNGQTIREFLTKYVDSLPSE